MIQARFFASLVLLAALALSQPARASELFNRPIFTADRYFVVEAPQSTTEIDDPTLPVHLRVFNQALASCHLKVEDLHGKLGMILDTSSALWKTEDLIFPQSLAQVKKKGITVVIDDFSTFAGNHPEYASYFVHDDDGPVIGLDCSSPVARAYWLPSLAHEFVHVLLDGKGVDSWWEEGIAQSLEDEIGGEQPGLTLRHLESASEIPSLIDSRRPLPDRESYAISFLFAQYVRAMFQGWKTLSAMTIGASRSCGQVDFLSRATCLGQASVNGETLLGSDKLTRAGLLRYFYVALTMASKTEPKYQIPRWPGFAKLPLEGPRMLEPGQAMVLRDSAGEINPMLEEYRVQVDANGFFVILPRAEFSRASPRFRAVEDYVLVLNLTPGPLGLE